MALRLLSIDDWPASVALAAFRAMLARPEVLMDLPKSGPAAIRRFLSLLPAEPVDGIALALDEEEWWDLDLAAHVATLKIVRGSRTHCDALQDFMGQISSGLDREDRLAKAGQRRR